MIIVPRFRGSLFDGPADRVTQTFSQHGSTGFADGRQLTKSPFLRTALLELAHEQTVRQHYEVHVPGLAIPVAQLTISHAQFLLTVPMKCLRSRPAISIDFQNPHYFPPHSVAHQHFLRRSVSTPVPDDYDPHLVVHFGNVTCEREVPLSLVSAAKLLLVAGINLGGQFVDPLNYPFPFDFAIRLQIADVAARPVEAIPFSHACDS